MSEKTIGLIAGVGPFAGADLFNKILAETVAAKDQDHLTVLSLSGPSEILDRTEYLLGKVAENPGHALARQLRRLAQAGAEVIGVPCNTAHSPEIFGLVQAEADRCGVQLLHMIGETGRFLREERPFLHNIGILSTTGTYLTRIYPAVLEPLGFTVQVPEREMQEAVVHTAVYHPSYGIKACGVATPQAVANLEQAMVALQQKGAEAIVLGCTEMPLAVQSSQWRGLHIVDPTRILARSLIREACQAKLKPIH
ncbi:MAG: aspartate/glutamate racemase family protein [Anaerolineales bacterium]|nr:aspartate/glutamate racemase family protein [Anaerolineales bacterium]